MIYKISEKYSLWLYHQTHLNSDCSSMNLLPHWSSFSLILTFQTKQAITWPRALCRACLSRTVHGQLPVLSHSLPRFFSENRVTISWESLPVPCLHLTSHAHNISHLSQRLLIWTNISPEIWSLGRTSSAVCSWIPEWSWNSKHILHSDGYTSQ